MLVIRDEQLAAHRGAMREQFVCVLMTHLRSLFPAEMEGVSDAALRDRVHRAIVSAAEYGLRGRRDVARFLNLLACFGWECDRSPDFAWLARGLRDERISTPSARLERVVQQAAERLQASEDRDRLRRRYGLQDE